MAVNQTRSTLSPIEISHPSARVVEGTGGDSNAPGLLHAIEQANWSAAQRTEQHCCILIGGNNWDGGTALRTIGPIYFNLAKEVKLHFDIFVRADFEKIEIALECALGASSTVEVDVQLTDENLNVHNEMFNIATGGGGDGSELLQTVDLDFQGINRGEWIEVEVYLTLGVGSLDTSELRMFRMQDVPMSAPYPLPEDT